MKTFTVTVEALVSTSYSIEANSEEAAFDKATEWFFDEKVSSLVVDNREQTVSEVRLLPVLFRRDRTKDFEVTAVFPTMPADDGGTLMTCYAHVGQHSGCSHGWYANTMPAAPADYADLLAELKRIYETGEDAVTLHVFRRITPEHRAAFDEAVQA